jgi:Flp pilus assembly protein TadD
MSSSESGFHKTKFVATQVANPVPTAIATTASDSGPKSSWYAVNCLVPQRRFEEATREIRLAQESDPLSPVIQTSLGLVHYFAGELVEAVSELKKTLDGDPGFAMAHFFLGQTYLQMSRAEDALAALGHASRLSPTSAEFRAGLGHAYAEAGESERARQILGDATTGTSRLP